MARSTGKNRTRLPSWMRRAPRRPAVTIAGLPAPAVPGQARLHPSPASPLAPQGWSVLLGIDTTSGRPIHLDLARDAHLLLEGATFTWPVGGVIEALTRRVIDHGAALTAIIPGFMDPPLPARPDLSCVTHAHAAAAIEDFHASMQTARTPRRPADHRFLLIDGLNWLRTKAKDNTRLATAVDELLLQVLVSGHRTGHHVIANDWTPRLAHFPGRAQLRAAFPALLQQPDAATHEDRAVLLASTGEHHLRFFPADLTVRTN
ncbi:hypothetical protein ABZ135_32680 [Streptomyces sp. NPDC006339]|uniref:hypothetical protein n=1 Tax=Streptomyces sp. NPDC006339 TaxID=3156755 RepID=UPI0033BD98A7